MGMMYVGKTLLVSLLLAFLLIARGDFEGAFNANHELLIAARNGNVGRIIQVIEHGAYLEARNNNGVSALIFASNNGHLEAVKTLLDRKADIEARSNDGRTPLIWAAHWGHLPVVDYLIERGAEIDAIDSNGMTALMSATLNRHLRVVEELISRGADVTTKNIYNGTALSIAKVKGFHEIEQVLDPYFVNEDELNPFLLLIEHAYLGLIQAYKKFLLSVRRYTGLHPSFLMESDDL